MEKAANRPKIGLVLAISFAVGTMIGAGVFVLSGPAIAATGPAALIAYATAGVSVLFSALSFSTIASLAPAGASGYAYVRTALGQYWGFITSWAFYIGGVIGCAFILNGFGIYLHQYFLPQMSPVFLALLAALALTLLNMGPSSLIGKAEVVLVGIKIFALLALIIAGIMHFSSASLHPFAPQGWRPVFSESGQLFVAFLGFSVVCSMAGDVRNASRTIPLAILLSMLIVALLYAGVVIALLSANLHEYSESSVAAAAGRLLGEHGPLIISIAALVSTLSCANANILGNSELIVRLAGKGEVPTFLGKMHNGHPTTSVIAGAVIYMGLILFGKTDRIVSFTNVSTILMLVLVNAATFVALRKKLVYKKLYPYSLAVPALGLLSGLAQLFLMQWENVIIGLLFVFSGSLFYVFRKELHDTADHRQIKRKLEKVDGPLGRALKEPEAAGA